MTLLSALIGIATGLWFYHLAGCVVVGAGLYRMFRFALRKHLPGTGSALQFVVLNKDLGGDSAPSRLGLGLANIDAVRDTLGTLDSIYWPPVLARPTQAVLSKQASRQT